MGQIIDFSGKVVKKTKQEYRDNELVDLLPKLKVLKNEILVFAVQDKIINNDKLLRDFVREIITLKYIGASVILIPDVNEKVEVYSQENFNLKNPFSISNFINLAGQIDVVDVIIKQESLNKVVRFFQDFNTMPVGFSGRDINIIFPNDVVNVNSSPFDRQNRNLYSEANVGKKKKYSVDILDELLKTDIIPIISPTFKDKQGNEFVFESFLFGAYIARYLNALKYTIVYNEENSIPTSCIYGVERFTKIVKTGSFSQKVVRMLNAGMDAVRNGVQGCHCLDTYGVSILEEFCGTTFSGLFLYDDDLGQV